MIGIVLAGGTGSRLWPLTKGFSKQLLPVYDKPMIHYPIGTLMLAGMREIVIITSPQDADVYKSVLGDGTQYGVKFEFAIQHKPEGIAQAFSVVENFIDGKKTCLILGDNVFHGVSLGRNLKQYSDIDGAQIFAYRVSNPTEYGVVDFSSDGEALSIEEKPQRPKSNYAIPGLYFYDQNVIEKSKTLKKSGRGEFEISDLNRMYLAEGKLNVTLLPRGTAWLDTGTPSDLQDASQFIRTLEERQGTKVNCLEEIAFLNGWTTKKDIEGVIRNIPNGTYKSYLMALIDEK